MRLKAQMDEFAWILIGALIFILIITLVWLPSREPSPLVDPKAVELNLVAGSATSFFITINGSAPGKLSNVTLTPLGGTKDWVSFDQNNFDIEDSVKVRVTVVVPKTVTAGGYIGSIKISSPGGETSVSLRINVVGITEVKLKSRPILLGDINIKYSVGSESLATRENLEIVKSYFTESDEVISIFIPSEKLFITTSGYINLTIEETTKEGNLIVIFNGYGLFNRKVSAGTLLIPIDKILINNTNSLTIKTTSPPWYKFWSKSVYKIKEASFVMNYQDILERERSFSLSDAEIANFKLFRLTGRVKEYSKPLGELIIKINNQLVYSKIPPLVSLNETFEKDIFGDMLYLTKDNTISFSFENEAYYKIEDAFLIVYYR